MSEKSTVEIEAGVGRREITPSAATVGSPFVVPPFDAGHHKPETKYVWWSWHPNYPNWSKSCWEGKTEDEAWAMLAAPFASSMRYYHNKLIREGDGNFVEVADLPCQEMDVWKSIKARMENS